MEIKNSYQFSEVHLTLAKDWTARHYINTPCYTFIVQGIDFLEQEPLTVTVLDGALRPVKGAHIHQGWGLINEAQDFGQALKDLLGSLIHFRLLNLQEEMDSLKQVLILIENI